MKLVTMVAWDFAPLRGSGGLAYAVGRLANQLSTLGVETTILFPAWSNSTTPAGVSPLVHPVPVELSDAVRHVSLWRQYSEFCHAAHASFERIAEQTSSDAIVVHSDESALFALMQRSKRVRTPLVFWLHSLFDPPIDDFSQEDRLLFSAKSLLASAIHVADVVVTSAGIMKDARELEWPASMQQLQDALRHAETDRRLLTVESTGCLPDASQTLSSRVTSSPRLVELDPKRRYVLFPARPSVDKGLALLAAVAERIKNDHIECVAIRRPFWKAQLEEPYDGLPLKWLPWLAQEELFLAMRGAACTLLPSITEGFGLATAESIFQGVPTLYQPIGGHHALKAFPNANAVSLSTDERATLYRVWADLCANVTDRWTAWNRHEQSLVSLVDKWVQAIRAIALSGEQPPTIDLTEPCLEMVAEHRWGNRLRDRIEGVRDAVDTSRRPESAV